MKHFRFETMDEWPRHMRLRPAHERLQSPFTSTWSNTTILLDRELSFHVIGEYAIVQLATRDLRESGTGPLARAVLDHPGVTISFRSTFDGPLALSTDLYRSWQDNVRAIALGLEAMRKIERYGIGNGREQFAGFRALGGGEPVEPIPEPEAWSPQYAAHVLVAHAGWKAEEADILLRSVSMTTQAYRAASKRQHPDRVGGDPGAFMKAKRARDVLVAYHEGKR